MLRKLTPMVQRLALRPIPQIKSSRHTSNTTKKDNVWEPDYLDALKPEFPEYDCLVVQIKGYDYPILESYQRHLHCVAEYLDIEVADCYALPPQQTNVNRLRPNSSVVEADYVLTMYKRNLQLNDVASPVYPIFLRLAQATLPEGVQLSVQQHTDDYDERRYVPDRDLLDLKAELERMQAHKKK